ncbi:uncharacterized protein LOC142979120 [Anticarsia gemmatalis]|uniref:uncharacterized protein LOC142979120 n=1 Tax=Anticarsia gemmatalis TaxID=129554 RepID=UPI003F771034
MPIVMTQKEWSRINKWAHPDHEDPEVARRREYVKYLNASSREMTKNWPNSLENVNKRNEELRQARIDAAEQANTKFYKRYLKNKKEEQERLMYSARDVVFKNRDAPKLLLSAVIETAVQKERIEQLKFLEERRREEAARKRAEDDDIIRKAKEWHELMATRRKRRFDANKQHQKDILEQAHEVSERNRIEHETELNLQKLDNIKANKEMAAIKEFDENFKEQEKARIFSDMERAKEECAQRRRVQAARDRMDDRLIEVLLRSRATIERRRKQTEIDTKNEKLRVLEAISAKLESGDADREAKDQAILNKAIKEKNDADEARREADRRKREGFKKDRQASRQKFLKDEEQRLHEFNTMRQWEIMNRFKNAELYEDFQEHLRAEKERKIKEYREDILRLWKERDDREARERAESRYFYGELAERKIRDSDNKLLTHAAHLLDECKELGRPDFALHRAIESYCKMHRLYPMPDLPTSMQEHFKRYSPWDGTKPDADYVEPPLPPPKQPEGFDNESTTDLTEKRAGLQEPPTAGASKPATSNAEKPSEDYKRAGPANGLQRRNLQTTNPLPAIKVLPCKNPDCKCELKPK